jgi:hypothetical protein
VPGTLRTEQDESFVSRQVLIKPSAISQRLAERIAALTLARYQLVVYQRPYPVYPVGDLILRRVSHLDAFSGYLCQT